MESLRASIQRKDLISERDLESQARDLLDAIVNVPTDTKLTEFGSAAWRPIKDLITKLSGSRATLGFSPSETALFVLSLKPAVFA